MFAANQSRDLNSTCRDQSQIPFPKEGKRTISGFVCIDGVEHKERKKREDNISSVKRSRKIKGC